MDDTSYYHPRLKTGVLRVEYIFADRLGMIWATGPVDMDGAISLFEGIDKRVRDIIAFMDNAPDTLYTEKDGRWEAWMVRDTDWAECYLKLAKKLVFHIGGGAASDARN